MPETSPQPRGWRWKRTVILALLLLAGGAVVNVAVAWGIALVADFHGSFNSESVTGELNDDVWYISVTEWRSRGRLTLWGRIPVERYEGDLRESERAIRRQRLDDALTLPGGSKAMAHLLAGNYSGLVYVIERGWPYRSLFYIVHREGYPDTQVQVVTGFDTGSKFAKTGFMRIIPFCPIFPGFIINTLFYALALWLLFFAPFATRRMLRRKRGLCEKCAYPIGVSPVCTECGVAVRRSHHAA